MGGGPKHVLGILSNIDQAIFEPFLICPSGYLSAEGKIISGVKVENFNPRSKFDFFSIFELRRIIHKILSSRDPFGPAILHVHGPRASFLTHWAAPSTVKIVYTEHIFDENYHLKNPINELLQKSILKKQNKNSSTIIAVSRSVKHYLIESKMADKEKVVVIPNGIVAKSIKKKHEVGLKHPIIGAIGNLNYQKGYPYLIDAMPQILKKFPTATLEIIGEGVDRGALEDQIKKLKLEKHITLLGYKNILERYFHRWSVYVMPSISETFGISALEAMQAGVPVIASRVGGLPDIITNNKNGIFIEPKKPSAIAKAVTDLLSSPTTEARLIREGKKRAELYRWENIIKKIEIVYLNLFK